MIRVAINGYGRIGRTAHRIILEKFSSELEVVAINAGSSTDLKGWMYLLKYDSVYGPLKNHQVNVILEGVERPIGSRDSITSLQNDNLLGQFVIDGKQIPVYAQKDPSLLPWKVHSVDVVIECTGHLLTKEKAQAHITAGVKAVVLSAPAKDDPSAGSGQVPTYVLSVNGDAYQGEDIISNASCTTNCITPVAKVMEDAFGIEKAMMTTIHGYTSDQRLHDGGHKDYRRARAAAENIIPTSTGATKAAAKALPTLQGIFAGLAIRVPVPTGSLSDFTFLLKKETTVEEVNTALTDAANSEKYKGILRATTDPIVSSDIVGDSHSAIVDLTLTQVVGGNMVKVIAWYDNEYGYTCRLVEMVAKVGGRQ